MEKEKNKQERTRIGKLSGIFGILCNLAVSSGKIITGAITGSVSIIADGINNLFDAASSVITLLGFHFAKRPADKEHPYGHARYEYLSGLAIAVLVLFVGFELIKSSVLKIISPEDITFSKVTFAVLIFSIAVKLAMWIFYRYYAKKINSGTLRANALDSISDVIATSAVLSGAILNSMFSINLDGYIGLGVAIFIIGSGISITKETVSSLLGERGDEKTVEEITKILLAEEKMLGFHDLLVHDYGPGQCFASVHAELSAEEDPLVCHDIIDGLECEVLEKLGVRLVIHHDPMVVDDDEWDELRQMACSTAESINEALSVHDFHIVKKEEITEIVFDLAVPYALEIKEQEIEETIKNEMNLPSEAYKIIIRFDKN